MGNGKMLFQCVNRSTKGCVTLYFDSTGEGVNYQVNEMSKCMAAQVFWYLNSKGFDELDIRKLIKGCFDIREQQRVTKSQFHKQKKLAYVIGNTEGEKDIIDTVMKSKEFDLMRGLSDAEKKQHAS